MSTQTGHSLSSLADFVHDAFTQAAISPDDSVSDAAFARFWCMLLTMRADDPTGTHSRAGFRNTVDAMRAQFAERTLLRETFVIATPVDASNRIGAVAATQVLSADQDTAHVTVTVVAMLRIPWVQGRGDQHGGRREIVTDAFIVNVKPET
ncbi:hypothetical protein FB451DRAFT_1172756 [Mycena latifolia]|nr:hypothetical protein FB451DRAFT_1172756 [Mycena latifolia]